MSYWRTHPADTTLILAVDRELPFPGRLALDQHLIACEACRSRLHAFEDAGQAATRVCRSRRCDDAAATSALRLRLHDRMSELGKEWDRSLLFRLRRAASSVPPLARVGVAVALLMLAVRLVQPRVSGPSPLRLSEHQSLPIGRLTPGAASNVSATDLCSGSHPTRRVVSLAVRQQVLQQYRMERVAPSEYELDYLITPELGGVAEARNLWPERYDSGVWNARVKDELEHLLPRLICDGTVDLGVAQREIADNWIDAYKKYFRTEHPIARQADLVEEDDDEIQFEPTPNVAIGNSALVKSQRLPLLLSAQLGTQQPFCTARVRRVAW